LRRELEQMQKIAELIDIFSWLWANIVQPN
jgi:hypothetical protein